MTEAAKRGIDRRHLLGAGVALAAGGAISPAPASTRMAGNCVGDEPMPVIPVPAQIPAREARIPVGDAALWYWDTGGRGEPIILFHAMTGSARSWPYQQPILSRRHRVIGYSRRGYWGSTIGEPGNPATAIDDLRLFLDALGIDRFHAVSTAGGAFVACAFAIAAPSRLRSLTLSCSMLGMRGEEIAPLTPLVDTPGINQMSAEFRELSPSYRSLNPAGCAAWNALYKEARGDNPRISQSYGPPNTLAGLSAIRAPTLLIAGGADLYAPPPVMRLFATRIPDSRLTILPEVGHSAHWERPDLFNRAVDDFVTRHSA